MLTNRTKEIALIEETLVEVLSRRPLIDACSAMAEAEISIVTKRTCEWRLAKIVHYQLRGLLKAEALSILLNVQKTLTAKTADNCNATFSALRNNQHPDLEQA